MKLESKWANRTDQVWNAPYRFQLSFQQKYIFVINCTVNLIITLSLESLEADCVISKTVD